MRARMMTTLMSVALLVTFSLVASARTFSNESNQASPSDNLSGKYEGVAKSDQLGDIPLTVEIKNDNGKLSGKIDTPQGPAAITSGTYADGKVTMKFDAGGNEGTVTATVDGDKITGKWELAGQGGRLELKRAGMVVAAAPASSVDAEEPARPRRRATWYPATGMPAADAQGTPYPFTLKLKLEGDKVTGTSDSAQGSAPLSKGTFGAGKLSFTLDTPNGAIGMTGTDQRRKDRRRL